MHLTTTWFGTFLQDENWVIKKQILFQKDPTHIATRLQQIENNEILKEEKQLMLAEKIDDLYATIMRQSFFTLFEIASLKNYIYAP